MRRWNFVRAAAFICAAALMGGHASAQEWPTKPVKIIIGFQPGGPSDVISRIVGDYLSKAWGQPIVVESRPGAAGNLAADLTAHAPADGYTMHLASMVVQSMYKAMYDKLNYDPEKDLVAVARLTATPMVLEVNNHVPVKTYDEFVAYLKKDGAKLNFGSPGVGTLPHLAAELYRARLGVGGVHVPYRGTAPFLDALLKNEVQWSVDVLGSVLAQKDKIRPFAVTAHQRIPDLPDVPTLAELGVKDAEAYTTWILVGPSAMPKPLVDKIAADVGKALADKATLDRLRAGGIYASYAGPADTLAFLNAEREKWVPIIKANNIKAE